MTYTRYANILLLFLVVTALFAYIAVPNYIASQKYAANSLRIQLKQKASALETQYGTAQSSLGLQNLLSYAQKSNMIENRDASAMYSDRGVAYGSPQSNLQKN